MIGHASYEIQNKQNYKAAEENLYNGKISIEDTG